MRTPDEIKKQIEGLKKEMSKLPEFSSFGDPNHKGIEAQIAIIESRTTTLDYEDEESFENDGECNYIRDQAEAAEMWLNGENNDDLFDEQYI